MAVKAEFESFRNNFLIATPALLDPNFFHSVTYICEHTPEGAMGIIINHPLDISIKDVLEHMEIEGTANEIKNMPVVSGGPVQRERGFVIHRPGEQLWQSTLNITDDIAITTSKDILEAIANGEGPDEAIIALGYAGWEPGQLEKEIVENTWIHAPITLDVLFKVPIDEKWRESARLIGIDNINYMATQPGHG